MSNMDDLDLDAFIADMEQSAPQEEQVGDKCPDCDVFLEEIEGNYVCPSCSSQANIIPVEEPDLYYDDMGRALVGQGVSLKEKPKRHQVDYGWAWSTDEAVVHILNEQVNALERCGLVPDLFRQGIKNMWIKYWVDNIAPLIRDEYTEADLIPLSMTKSLKTRDLEVLVKVRDKVMVPEHKSKLSKNSTKSYKMYGVNFRKTSAASNLQTPYVDSPDATPTSSYLDSPLRMQRELSIENQMVDASSADDQTSGNRLTRHISIDNISVLTINRTLAFIEATARCMDLANPLFASDIVRACNQRVIPLFGAHKILPEEFKLNFKDRMMFQNTRPPNPIELTKAASLLVRKIYSDRFPILFPVPNLERILDRFLRDMNLPCDLMNYLSGSVNFSTFRQTRPLRLTSTCPITHRFPQYDRWAYSILLSQMKRLFSLDSESVFEQSQEARKESESTGENIFILWDWIRQLSIRLNLILSYDSFSMNHPMTDLKDIQPTAQLYKFIDTALGERVVSTTRARPNLPVHDDIFRSELTDFLITQIPKPFPKKEFPRDQELEKPHNITSPIQDAFQRTKPHWSSEICSDPEVSELIFKDYSCCRVSLPKDPPNRWTIYDDDCPVNSKFETSPNWPYCFKLLLSVGGYLCYCNPKELLYEFRQVEEYLYPEMKVLKKRKLLSKRNKCADTLE